MANKKDSTSKKKTTKKNVVIEPTEDEMNKIIDELGLDETITSEDILNKKSKYVSPEITVNVETGEGAVEEIKEEPKTEIIDDTVQEPKSIEEPKEEPNIVEDVHEESKDIKKKTFPIKYVNVHMGRIYN